jgi:hypothetical protein
MRAFVVELAGADDAHLRGIIDARPLPLPAGDAAPAARGPDAADGELAASPADARQAAVEGEPL